MPTHETDLKQTQESLQKREDALLRAVEKLDKAIQLWQDFDRRRGIRYSA